jgi:hypothetical protein
LYDTLWVPDPTEIALMVLYRFGFAILNVVPREKIKVFERECLADDRADPVLYRLMGFPVFWYSPHVVDKAAAVAFSVFGSRKRGTGTSMKGCGV